MNFLSAISLHSRSIEKFTSVNSREYLMLSLPTHLDGVDYHYQRVYVSAMMKLIARLFKAGSEVDDEIIREVANLPEGYLFRMEVLPGSPAMMLQKREGVLHVLPENSPLEPDLRIAFKHISHAFLVFSFQEGTAQAYANERLILDGDPGLAMKVVRCLNRVQSVVLPKMIAEKAVKTLPDFTLMEKLNVSTKTYSKLLINLLKEL